jgi:hypothetical protein
MYKVQTVLIITQNYVKLAKFETRLFALHLTSLTASSVRNVRHSWHGPGTGILFKYFIRYYVSSGAVAATVFSEMLSGRQRLIDVKVEPSHQQHPEDGGGVNYRNVGKRSHLEAAVCLFVRERIIEIRHGCSTARS